MTVEAAFGQVLKAIMDQRGLSQAEMIRRTGLDRTTVPKYVHGKRAPNFKSILLIAKALDLPAYELVRQVEAKLNT